MAIITATRRASSAVTLTTAALLLATAASAQYKSVGPDGRITYSDLPPPSTSRIVNEKRAAEPPSSTVALPFELQQAVSKYPVTLYTGDRCGPCDDARGYLRSSGIPFTEKTVTSDDDITLFRQQSPDGTAPVVTVGSRRSVGFSQAALAGLLDNAGYPQAAVLPRDYQYPAPTPLSPTTRAPAEAVGPRQGAAGRPGTAATPAPTTSPTSPGSPPGFRF